MIKSKDLQVMIFEITNEKFECVGELNAVEGLIWREAFAGYDSFELFVPLNVDNFKLLKLGNVVWVKNRLSAGFVEIINIQNKNGKDTISVKGRTLEKLMLDRIVVGTVVTHGFTALENAYTIADKNIFTPDDYNRTIPYMALGLGEDNTQIIDTYQKTGGTVYDAVYELANAFDFGFEIAFLPQMQELIFTLIQTRDCTVNQTMNNQIVFSTEFNNLIQSTIYQNNTDDKNTAYVYGEDKGADRKFIIHQNDSSLTMLDRKELYIDARDLQSTYFEDNVEHTLTPEQYEKLLNQRAVDKLTQSVPVCDFDAQIYEDKLNGFVYGADFYLGDYITIEFKELNLRGKAFISAVEEDYDENGIDRFLTLKFSDLKNIN